MVEMEWYESMLDTMSCTRTPLSVLDRHFTKSESETTSIITSTTTITNGSTVPEIKRRKLNGYSSKWWNILFSFSHFWYYWDSAIGPYLSIINVTTIIETQKKIKAKRKEKKELWFRAIEIYCKLSWLCSKRRRRNPLLAMRLSSKFYFFAFYRILGWNEKGINGMGPWRTRQSFECCLPHLFVFVVCRVEFGCVPCLVEKRGTYQDNELLHGKKQEMNCIFFGQRIGESLSWIIKKRKKISKEFGGK